MSHHHPSFLFQFGPTRYEITPTCPCRCCTMPGKVDFPRRAEVSVTVCVSPTTGEQEPIKACGAHHE